MGDTAAQAAVAVPPQAVGGAAILARLRAQRAAAAGASAAAPATPPAAPISTAAASAINTAAAMPAADAAAAAKPSLQPAAAAAAPPTTKVETTHATAQPAAAPSPTKPTAPVASGGAAILARLRAQRAAQSAGSQGPPAKELVVLYASQTGTASEIAKNIQAEAEQKGIKGKVASMNEFGFENLNPDHTPVLIFVASSTGDGDAPDNGAKFYATLRRKSQPQGLLKGITFTGFGLGDSNYTRYQHVPRAIKTRLLDLGGTLFYPVGEADEVDGIEEALDKWLEGLWPTLRKAVQPEGAVDAPENGTADGVASAAKPATGAADELAGVPPLPGCRVQLVWKEGGEAAAVRSAEACAPREAELSYRDPEGQYSADQPYWAPVTDGRYLTTEASHPDRQVLHLELDISGSGMRYAPGDSIGVLPRNDPQLVTQLLQRLQLEGDAVFDVAPAGADAAAASSTAANANGAAATERLLPHLHAPCSVRAALEWGVDLTGPPRKSLLRLLAEHCSNGDEKRRLLRLCSRDGRDEYAAHMLEGRPTLLQLLQQFSSCRPPLDALLDALPPLAPRMYSVSCSPLECPDRVQVAFTVVRYSTQHYGDHTGVATTWLHRLCDPILSKEQSAAETNLRLPIFLRRGGVFGPPASLETPLIMIGPGTGVTPFRGFLQHRRAQLAAAGKSSAAGGAGDAVGSTASSCGPAWLYFGCRREDHDYLYREDLEGFVSDGTLDRLHLAFSRAQRHKVYVQHLMAEHAAELYDLVVRRGACVYLCGDGAAMAKDVHSCLATILRDQGGLTEAEAAERLAELTRQGRYVRDIWS